MNTQMVPPDTSGHILGNILSYLVTNASQEPGFEHVSFTSHPASESGSSSNGDFIALARSWISYPKNRNLQHTQMNTQMVPHDTSGPSLSNIWSYLVTDTSKESGFEHASLTSHPASESGSLFFWMIMSTIPPFPHRQGSAVNNKGGVLNMLVFLISWPLNWPVNQLTNEPADQLTRSTLREVGLGAGRMVGLEGDWLMFVF